MYNGIWIDIIVCLGFDVSNGFMIDGDLIICIIVMCLNINYRWNILISKYVLFYGLNLIMLYNINVIKVFYFW